MVLTDVLRQMSLYRFPGFILLLCLYIYTYIYPCDKNCTSILYPKYNYSYLYSYSYYNLTSYNVC